MTSKDLTVLGLLIIVFWAEVALLMEQKEEAYLNGITKTIEFIPVSVIQNKLEGLS
jgi:hypothetical protein